MRWTKEISYMISEETKSFLHYLKHNKVLIGVVFFFAIFSYGFLLTHYTLSIDEEISLFSDSINSVWIGQGRFGIALLKLLFNNTLTQSITATFLAITTFSISSVIWAYAFNLSSVNEKKVKGQDIPGIAAALMFVTFPAYSENLGFSIMSFELGLGWIMASSATILIFKWVICKKNKIYMYFGLILTTLSTSIYQSFLPVIVCGLIVCYIVYLYSLQKEGRKVNLKDYFLVIIKWISLIFLSLICYKIIDRILSFFIPQSNYVSSFIAWGKSDTREIISALLGNFWKIFSGELIHGSFILLPSLIISILILFINVYRLFSRKTSQSNGLIIGISLLGFTATPFLMSLILGNPMPIRANLVLTLFVASVWYLLLLLLTKNALRKVVFILIFFVAFHQSQSLSQLFYSDYNRYQDDVKLAHQIGYTILELDLGEYPTQPVVFVGSHVQETRRNLVKQEALGHSFFEWDGGNPTRISKFFKSLGYKYAEPSFEESKKGNEYARNMPAWPKKGSIDLVDNLIIVNLSENIDKYRLEFLDKENIDSSINNNSIFEIKMNSLNSVFYNDLNSIEVNDDDYIYLQSGKVDPQVSFHLDEKLDNNSYNLIAFEFESDIEGQMYVFLAQDNEEYSDKFSGPVQVEKGKNIIFLKKHSLMSEIKGVRIDPPNNSRFKIESIKFIK